MDEKVATLAFSLFDGIGPKTFLKLLKHFGSAKNAWSNLDIKNIKQVGISESLYNKFDSFRKTFKSDEYLEKIKKARVKIITYTESEYPELLKKLKNPPIVLFCKGNLKLLSSKKTLGVVGARKITSYGREVTEKIVSDLINYNFTIVSGLAMGVDAQAHTTTIKSKGLTIAVLGCGVDCATPAENQDLYEKILDSDGLIISEYPLGTPPNKGSFPMRNRIIAGLSLGVLITEAAEDSGSLITAEEAIKLERPVFAVPGSINSQMSRGSLKLLKQGGILVQSSEDILKEFRMQNVEFRIENKKDKLKDLKLGILERRIVKVIESEALSLDQISKKTKIPIVKLMAITSSLEMRGIIVNSGGELRLTA